MKAVYIEWEDAHNSPVWMNGTEIKDFCEKSTMIVSEVGWLIAESNKHIVIAPRMTSDGGIGDPIKIPKPWVRNRKDLSKAIAQKPKKSKKRVRS